MDSLTAGRCGEVNSSNRPFCVVDPWTLLYGVDCSFLWG
jgi:hypothetical protein